MLLAALVLTFSITSVLALLAGLLVLAGLRYGPKGVAVGVVATLAVSAVVYLAAGGDDLGPDRGDVNNVTSGRAGLVEGGIELAEDRPLAGWGSGAFGRAYFDQIRESETTTSHSEPLTVAAEQGAIGAGRLPRPARDQPLGAVRRGGALVGRPLRGSRLHGRDDRAQHRLRRLRSSTRPPGRCSRSAWGCTRAPAKRPSRPPWSTCAA